MRKRSFTSPPCQPYPLAVCTRTLFGVLFLLILAKKKLVSQRLADGASRCDLSQEYLHVNRASREPRTASRSQMKAVLKVDRGASWAPGALLCGPLWMVLLWASLQLLLKRCGLAQNSRTKQLCLPPGKTLLPGPCEQFLP